MSIFMRVFRKGKGQIPVFSIMSKFFWWLAGILKNDFLWLARPQTSNPLNHFPLIPFLASFNRLPHHTTTYNSSNKPRAITYLSPKLNNNHPHQKLHHFPLHPKFIPNTSQSIHLNTFPSSYTTHYIHPINDYNNNYNRNPISQGFNGSDFSRLAIWGPYRYDP